MCLKRLQATIDQRPPAALTTHTVTSRDGTRIAFDRLGEGPPLVLVEGALMHRKVDSVGARLARLLTHTFTVYRYDRRGRGASGDLPPYSVAREIDDLQAVVATAGNTAGSGVCVFGRSSGAVLALDAACRLPGIAKLGLDEPPFIVDDSRPELPADYLPELNELIAAGRRGDAVTLYLTAVVGTSEADVAAMRAGPRWAALEAVAHTLTYDYTIMAGTQMGRPLRASRWESVSAPAVILTSEGSERFVDAGARALAGVLPSARHRVLPQRDDDESDLMMLALELQRFFL